MVVENKAEKIIDMGNYFTYQRFAYGFPWMTPDIYKQTSKIIRDSDYNIEHSVNSPLLWNAIGVSLYNMPYVKNQDGSYSFLIPVYSDVIEGDVQIQNTIGKIIKKLIKVEPGDLPIDKPIRFFLYNSRISVSGDDSYIDPNIAAIIFNVISVFLLRFIREKNNILKA